MILCVASGACKFLKERTTKEQVCNMASTNIIFQGALPVFDGKNFDDWRIKMNAIFGFQEVAEVVKTGVQEPGRNATEEQKAKHKELVKLHRKTRILIYQCVEAKIFNNISKAATSKEA